MKTKVLTMIMLFLFHTIAFATTGEKLFKEYCWGCHHQTSLAFGPSFEDIASKRDAMEIQAYILSPKSMYEAFGYERSVMPSFQEVLSEDEIEALAEFILSFDVIKF
jgi:mono/diheme cytochrome c family protein